MFFVGRAIGSLLAEELVSPGGQGSQRGRDVGGGGRIGRLPGDTSSQSQSRTLVTGSSSSLFIELTVSLKFAHEDNRVT